MQATWNETCSSDNRKWRRSVPSEALTKDFLASLRVLVSKRAAAYVAALAIGGVGAGYAAHEHSKAQNLAAQNEQLTAALNATRNQLDALAAKVNTLAILSETQPAPSPPPTQVATSRRALAPRPHSDDPRFNKLAAQLGVT